MLGVPRPPSRAATPSSRPETPMEDFWAKLPDLEDVQNDDLPDLQSEKLGRSLFFFLVLT